MDLTVSHIVLKSLLQQGLCIVRPVLEHREGLRELADDLVLFDLLVPDDERHFARLDKHHGRGDVLLGSVLGVGKDARVVLAGREVVCVDIDFLKHLREPTALRVVDLRNLEHVDQVVGLVAVGEQVLEILDPFAVMVLRVSLSQLVRPVELVLH